jgi:hypothetical protein
MHQKYMSKRLSIFVLFFYTEDTQYTDDRRNMRILKEQVRLFFLDAIQSLGCRKRAERNV